MSMKICGMGWVTPLGNDLDQVWEALMNGESAEVKQLSRNGRSHFYIPVPSRLVESLGKNPRLRRSSPISYFTAAAGLAALENAGLKMTPKIAARTAIIFSIASGGVVYTKKFYETIVAQGAQAASPLLFPETVYNAPASHLAALLGINGASYTLVGDASVGITALKHAEQLLDSDEIDYCVIIGGEEVDWVLCEAYREWRLVTTEPKINIYSTHHRGTLLAEGAAALVVSREGPIQVRQIHDGVPFFKQSQLPNAIHKVYKELVQNDSVDLVIACANGTFIDTGEAAAIRSFFPTAPVYCPKPAFGEALGASGLMQTIIGALALTRREVPPVYGLHETDIHLTHAPLKNHLLKTALVSASGFNQQASGLILSNS